MIFLVEKRGVETLGGFEGLEARHDDTIERWDDGRRVSPAPAVRAGDLDEPLGLSLGITCFWRLKCRLYRPPG
jgi:CheB methylesterase